ncbi:MAG TPA: hypothetical protein VFF64_03860 [Candidatus Eremiobacteraceae bacterium]|nr:hypothetical protein [Candidatus Eremiobacteraceae bacterium]
MDSAFSTRYDLRALNQRGRQFQAPSQLAFFASHLAVIVLVIEASQVKDSVQDKNFYFFRQRMLKQVGIIAGNVGGDRYLTCNSSSLVVCGRQRRKRQYVGGFVCTPKSPIKRAQLLAVGH